MAKTAVYSWRVSPEVKAALEHAARRENGSVSTLLDRIVQQWLRDGRRGTGEEPEQARLHAAAEQVIGTIRGGNRRRAEQARDTLRKRLRRRRVR
jgi:hypothetical protein